MVQLAVANFAGICCRLQYCHAAGFGRNIYWLSGIVTARQKAIYPELHAYNMPHMGLRNAFFWYVHYIQFCMVEDILTKCRTRQNAAPTQLVGKMQF